MHESSDKNSGSDDSNVHDLWEEGEFMSGNNRNNDNSSGEHNVLSEEQSEDVKNSKESSGQERSAICQLLSLSDSFIYDKYDYDL